MSETHDAPPPDHTETEAHTGGEGLLQEIVDFLHWAFPGASSGRTPPGVPSHVKEPPPETPAEPVAETPPPAA